MFPITIFLVYLNLPFILSIRRSQKGIDRLGLYEHNYAFLSDYVHLVLRHPFLQKTETFEKISVGVMSQSLCNLVGVIDAVIVFNAFEWDEDLKRDVECFRDRYE